MWLSFKEMKQNNPPVDYSKYKIDKIEKQGVRECGRNSE